LGEDEVSFGNSLKCSTKCIFSHIFFLKHCICLFILLVQVWTN
jgi:hypothetical protein